MRLFALFTLLFALAFALSMRGRAPAEARADAGQGAPAVTAHTTLVSTPTSPWRTPRRLRGSATPASAERRSGATATGSGSSTPATWPARAAMDKDADAGTALFR